MPEQPERVLSRDFAFQKTDLGSIDPGSEVEIAPGSFTPSDTSGIRAADRVSNPSLTAMIPTLTPSSTSAGSRETEAETAGPVTTTTDSAQYLHPSLLADTEHNAYIFTPGGPLLWDWDSSMDAVGFGTFFEPQGELVEELQHQQPPRQDFSIPRPVNARMDSQIAEQVQTPIATGTELPLSLAELAPSLDSPPQNPGIRTKSKRKADSDPIPTPGEAINPVEAAQRPAKRVAMSSKSPVGSGNPSTSQSDLQPATGGSTSTSSTSLSASGTGRISTRHEGASTGAIPAGTQPPATGREAPTSTARKVVEARVTRGHVLPAGKVFPIQIASELFRLSGASISSDGKRLQIREAYINTSRLTVLEHPRTSLISSESSCIVQQAGLVER